MIVHKSRLRSTHMWFTRAKNVITPHQTTEDIGQTPTSTQHVATLCVELHCMSVVVSMEFFAKSPPRRVDEARAARAY